MPSAFAASRRESRTRGTCDVRTALTAGTIGLRGAASRIAPTWRARAKTPSRPSPEPGEPEAIARMHGGVWQESACLVITKPSPLGVGRLQEVDQGAHPRFDGPAAPPLALSLAPRLSSSQSERRS